MHPLGLNHSYAAAWLDPAMRICAADFDWNRRKTAALRGDDSREVFPPDRIVL